MKKNFKIFVSLTLMTLFLVFTTKPGHGQWNPNTYVNTAISTLNVADQQTVATSDGKMWIAYYAHEGSNYNMYAQLLDANGNKLLGNDGFLVSNQVSGSAIFVFNACLDASNNLIISCQDMRSGSQQCVIYKISQAGAHLWSSSGVIVGAGLSPYSAALSTGEVIVAFNATTGSTLNLQKIKTDGTLAWATPKAVLVGTVKTTRGQVIGTSNGNFTMVFQKKGTGVSSTLWVQRFDSAGAGISTQAQLSTLTASSSRYYSVLADADTVYCGYYVASGSRFNSYLQRIPPDGSVPWGNNGANFCTAVASTDPYQMMTSISHWTSSPYIWSVCSFTNSAQSNYGVYIQKFNKVNGTRIFGDGAKNVFPIAATRETQAGNLVTVNDSPMFMLYDVNYKIYSTRLDVNGDFAWPVNRVEISSTTATAGTPKGRFGFSVAGPNKCAGYWYEDRSTGIGYMGYAQGISINGLVGIKVYTENNVPATITTTHGTLQVIDTVFPTTMNQNVTWSIVPGTGTAGITSTGLITALTDGIVYAKAVSVIDNTMKDSLLITITGQTPPPCNAPAGVAVSQILSASALVRWLAADPLPASGYEYEVRTSGDPGSGATGLAVSGTTPTGVDSVLLTTLTGGTTYFVYLRSNCGDGNFSQWSTAVSFTTIPVSITLTGSVSESHAYCYNASGTIIVAGNGTTFTILNGGSATMIAGVSISYLPGTKVVSGGYMHGYITLTNDYCQTPSNPLVNNELQPDETPQSFAPASISDEIHFIAFPNPTNGKFILKQTGTDSNQEKVNVEIFNIAGKKLIPADSNPEQNLEFSLTGFLPGIYLVAVHHGEKTEMIKIVKW